jgi:hypothetical protein
MPSCSAGDGRRGAARGARLGGLLARRDASASASLATDGAYALFERLVNGASCGSGLRSAVGPALKAGFHALPSTVAIQ